MYNNSPYDHSFMGNPNLKKVGTTFEWTPDLVEEYKKCMDSPIYFAEKYIKIVHVDKGLIPIQLFDYQRELLEAFSTNNRIILTTARQMGKTTAAVAIILHYILFNRHKSVALLSNKAASANEILARIRLAYESLPQWLQQGMVTWNKGSIELENGCSVFAAASSSSSIRGRSVSFLYIDEAAFIPRWDEFSNSVLPTIASGESTKLLYTSTPNGLNHYFYTWDAALKKENEFYAIEAKWDKHPARDEKWKMKTLSDMNFDTMKFAQEYECVYGNSLVTIRHKSTKIPVEMAIGDFYRMADEGGSCVYMITRSDSLKYVGITVDLFSRLKEHSKTKRFEMGIEKVEVLYHSKSYQECEYLEEKFIIKYDTYKKGLNKTPTGKGLNETEKFNNYGMPHSDETREKMSANHWLRNGGINPMIGKEHSANTKLKWSQSRKGKANSMKISREAARSIHEIFSNNSLELEKNLDLIKRVCKKSDISKVGVLDLCELKNKGGQWLTLKSLYLEFYHEKYDNVSKNAIRNILEGKFV